MFLFPIVKLYVLNVPSAGFGELAATVAANPQADAPDGRPKARWVCVFYRVSSLVFVGGGAWASHTPKSYPEPYPRAIPQVIPLKKQKNNLQELWHLHVIHG